eukprot:127830-Pyramimonas_sp.AAC.1
MQISHRNLIAGAFCSDRPCAMSPGRSACDRELLDEPDTRSKQPPFPHHRRDQRERQRGGPGTKELRGYIGIPAPNRSIRPRTK